MFSRESARMLWCFGVYFILLSTYGFSGTDAFSMAVDLGSETMKIAVVVPRKPMDVVLDNDSHRKTPTAIGFRGNDRYFGRSALTLAARSPELVFQSFPILIGKTLDHPVVKVFRERFPFHNISYNETNGQLELQHVNGMQFTVEELVAMLLEHARDLAERHAGENIVLRTVVLTVPTCYGQAERRSLIRAAEIAGLEVIQLIGADTAVALNYGLPRYSTFSETAQYVLFFDVGYASTTATVVSYQTTAAGAGPTLSVIGFGFDPTLGTSTFIGLLRTHLLQLFRSSNPGIKGDITENQKSMAKLTLETSRVFTVLSANTETLSQIENLFEGLDFHAKVSRADLESVCGDEFERLRRPFLDALHASKRDIADIREIVLMGGGTRVPKVQSILMELGNRSELGKGVNSDEAAVLGAVYQAASRTPGFKVLPVIVREYNPYPIAADFERARNSTAATTDPAESDSTASADHPKSPYVRRVLFPRGNPYPQKRAITFNLHVEDMVFFTNYAELTNNELTYLVTPNISEVTTVGVASAAARHSHAELRGVKAHFTLDHNGLLVLTGIDCVFRPVTEVGDKQTDQSTLQKLGSTISGLFGAISGSSDDKANATESPPSTTADTAAGASNHTNATDANSFNNTTSSPLNTSNSVSQNQSKTPEKKVAVFTERISFVSVYRDRPTPTDDDKRAAKEKLRVLSVADQDKRDWENAMNELESTLFSTRDKIQSDVYMQHSTRDELDTLSRLITAHLTWYDDQGPATKKEEFEEKYHEIREHLLPIEMRVTETQNRPRAFADLIKQLDEAMGFLEVIKDTMAKMAPIRDALNASTAPVTGENATSNVTLDPFPLFPTLFTDNERLSLEVLINHTQTWINDSQKKLAETPAVERPPILVSEIEEKQRQIKREVQYLNKKLLMWQREMERLLQLQSARSATPPSPPPPSDDGTTKSPPTETETENKTHSTKEESVTLEPESPARGSSDKDEL